MVPNNSFRRMNALPPGQTSSHAQFGVITIREQILVERTNLVQHLATVHGRAAVRPKKFIRRIELTAIALPGSSSAVLAVRPDKVSNFIDSRWILPHKHFACNHSDSGTL